MLRCGKERCGPHTTSAVDLRAARSAGNDVSPAHNLSLFPKTFALPPHTSITRIHPRFTTTTTPNIRIAPRYTSSPPAQASLHRRTPSNRVRNRTGTRAIDDSRRGFCARTERRRTHVPWARPARRLSVARPWSYQPRNRHSGVYMSAAAYAVAVLGRGAWVYT